MEAAPSSTASRPAAIKWALNIGGYSYDSYINPPLTRTSTRRAILIGAAAVPALSLPVIAAEPDPVFAAIERHRIAETAFRGSGQSDDELNERGSMSWKLYCELLATGPTTVAGCSALSRHIEAYEAYYDRLLYADCGEPVCSKGDRILSRIAGALEKRLAGY
jgi:hypothetical protein